MIARHDAPDLWQSIDGMNQEQLINLMISCDAPTVDDEIANRMSYCDPLTLKRLAFLSQLRAAHRGLKQGHD